MIIKHSQPPQNIEMLSTIRSQSCGIASEFDTAASYTDLGLQFPLFTSKIIRSLAPCGLLWRRRGQAPKLRYNRKHQP